MGIGFKGTSISDIEQGAEDALEEDIANLSPANNSVAGQLDGGISGGVDWAAKSPNYVQGTGSGSSTTTIVSVSGSGYLITAFGDDPSNLGVDVDGSSVFSEIGDYTTNPRSVTLYYRFDSSFAIVDTGSASQNNGGAFYVLD